MRKEPGGLRSGMGDNVNWTLVSISEDEKYNEQLRTLQKITH